MWKLNVILLVFVLCVYEQTLGDTLYWNATSGNNEWHVRTNWYLAGGGYPATGGPTSSDTAFLYSECPPSVVLTGGPAVVHSIMIGDGSNTYPGDCEIGASLTLEGSVTVLSDFQADLYTNLIFPSYVSGYLLALNNVMSFGNLIASNCPSGGWSGINVEAPNLDINGTVNITESTFYFGAIGMVIFDTGSVVNLMGKTNIIFTNDYIISVYFNTLNIFGPCVMEFQDSTILFPYLLLNGNTTISLPLVTDTVVFGSNTYGAVDTITMSGDIVVNNGSIIVLTATWILNENSVITLCPNCSLQLLGANNSPSPFYYSLGGSAINGGTVHYAVPGSYLVSQASSNFVFYNVTASYACFYGVYNNCTFVVNSTENILGGVLTNSTVIVLSGHQYLEAACYNTTIINLGGTFDSYSDTCFW